MYQLRYAYRPNDSDTDMRVHTSEICIEPSSVSPATCNLSKDLASVVIMTCISNPDVQAIWSRLTWQLHSAEGRVVFWILASLGNGSLSGGCKVLLRMRFHAVPSLGARIDAICLAKHRLNGTRRADIYPSSIDYNNKEASRPSCVRFGSHLAGEYTRTRIVRTEAYLYESG